MFTLKHVELKNFLSHADTSLSFSGEEKMLIDGQSGSGKSAIAEGIVWCLYGKGRTDSRSLVRRRCQEGHVSVSLTDGTDTYTVTRNITDSGKTTLSVFHGTNGDQRPVDISGVKQTQAWIEKELIGASYEMFVNSVVFPQDHPDSFVSMPPAGRKELILEMLPIAELDTVSTRITERITELTSAISASVGAREVIKKVIFRKEAVVSALSDAESALSTQTEEEKRLSVQHDMAVREELRRAESAKQRETYLSMAKALEDSIAAATKKIVELNAAIEDAARADTSDLERLAAQLPELKALMSVADAKRMELAAVKNDLEVLRKESSRTEIVPVELHMREIDSCKSQIESVRSDTSSFCGQAGAECPRLAEEKKKRIEMLEGEILWREKAVEDARRRKTELANTLAAAELAYAEAESAYEACGAQALAVRLQNAYDASVMLESARTRAQDAKRYRGEVAAYEEEVKGNKKRLDSVRSSIPPVETESKPTIDPTAIEKDLAHTRRWISDCVGRIGALRQELDAIAKAEEELEEKKAEISVLTERLQVFQDLKVAFGPNGIRAVAVDSLIPELEERMNAILSKLSDFRIELETQKMAADGGAKEGLFINIVAGDGNTMDFANYSGGERLRINVAIFEGFASMSKCGFRVYDESIVGLDRETLDALGDIVLHLKGSNKQVFCISHVQEIKQLFDERITAVKTAGITKII